MRHGRARFYSWLSIFQVFDRSDTPFVMYVDADFAMDHFEIFCPHCLGSFVVLMEITTFEFAYCCHDYKSPPASFDAIAIVFSNFLFRFRKAAWILHIPHRFATKVALVFFIL